MTQQQFKALGNKVTEFGGLEVIDIPLSVKCVTFTSDEVTAVCPVTGQPDWYKVKIELFHIPYTLESKSLKLYLQSFKDQGIFAEGLAAQIVKDIVKAIGNIGQWGIVRTVVTQKSRGGITLEAFASSSD